MTIGRNIKRIRRMKRITQEELSKRTGIAVETISRWENDKFQPNIKQIERIANALDISSAAIFELNEPKPRKPKKLQEGSPLPENTVGYLVRKYRIQQGFTAERLANATGRTKAENILGIERGVFVPKLDFRIDIAKALNISVLQLLPEISFAIEEIQNGSGKCLEDYSTLELLQELERRAELGS